MRNYRLTIRKPMLLRMARAPQRYDFRRPKTFNRDHARALQIAAETFARQWTTALSMTLRAVSVVTVRCIEQRTYEEHVGGIPNPSYLAVLALPPLPGHALLHLPQRLAMTVVDRLVGGRGGPRQPGRAVTEIEAQLLRSHLRRALAALAEGFASITPVEPELVAHEANPQFAQLAAPADMVVVIELDVRIAGSEGVASLAIPFKAVQPVLDEVTHRGGDDGFGHVAATAVRASLEERLDHVPLPVSLRFPEVTLTAAEVAALRPGALVDLHHPTDAPLEVAVSGITRLVGRAGRLGQRLAAEVLDDGG
jgi:flagellar motor switch protein FliM